MCLLYSALHKPGRILIILQIWLILIMTSWDIIFIVVFPIVQLRKLRQREDYLFKAIYDFINKDI